MLSTFTDIGDGLALSACLWSMTMATSKSFIKANSQSDMAAAKKLDRLDSLRGSLSEPLIEDTFGPLSNVR